MRKSYAAPSMDKNYQAEDDARHLMRAFEVQSDRKRLKAAQAALKKVETEAQQSLMYTKVAKKLKQTFSED